MPKSNPFHSDRENRRKSKMRSIMDSISDLSLLEIAGEDDSLLSGVSTATNVFACSPLLSLRSRPPQTKGIESGAVDSEDLISSPKDSANKENTNRSKPEAPKLSVEPQQMKRKKKVGGYNLRKSLAWDRAFFTEQGVLNPSELSMISGTTTPNAKSSLEVIHEEEPVTTSIALQEIEENLFKHSSEGVPIGDRKIGAGARLSPKPGALTKQTPSPASLAKRKVLAVNDVVGNRSKRSACPRPVPSSSTDTVKGPSKELKITRVPGPKSSDVSAHTTTARSGTLSTGSSKRNQNAHPATNVQKYAGVKGLSQNPKTVPSNAKGEPADKCSVTRTLTKQAGKHLDKSVSETHPPSRMHQPGSGANKVTEACLPQGVSDTCEKKQQTLFQIKKLSGLRMPSPSLGFFSQTKASSSHGQLQKSSIPCKPSESNIPKLRKLETISVNEARSKIVKRAAKNCTKELRLSDIKSDPSVQIDNKQMAGVQVECDSLGFEKRSKHAKVENILEHVNLISKEQGELHENENVSSMENRVFPRPENKVLSNSHKHEQLEKEADHTLDDKLYDVLSNGDRSLFQGPESLHYDSMQRTSNNISNTVHNAKGQDEDDQIKLLTCDVLTFKESSVLQAEHGISLEDGRHSGEFKKYSSVQTALLNSSPNDFSKTVLEGSIQGIPCENTEQVNVGAGDFGRCGGDAQVHLQGEQLKAPNHNMVGEIRSKKENESNVNSCLLVHMTTLFSKGSPEKSILEIDGASESESKIAEIKDCQLPVDGQSGLIPRRPMDEEDDQVDSKAIHDRKAFELDRLSEDCITVSATACCTKETNVSPERRPFSENDIKNLHLTSQLCPTVKADCDSGGNDMPSNNCRTISESQLRDDNFSRDTSIHCDVQHDVLGNFEQQISMFTHPEINEMPSKDESLVPNHGHLLHQSEFSEVSADLISNTKDSIGSGAENPSGLLQHTLLAQSVQEFDHTNREIEESHEEDAQAQSFDENPVAHDCSNKHCLAVTNDQFFLADDNNINEDSHLSEFQKPSVVVTVDSQNVNNVLHLDSDCLPTNIASSEEIKETKLVEGAFEGCCIHTSEYNASNYHIQAMPEDKDGNHDVDEKAELLFIDGGKNGSSDILPLVEVQVNDDVTSAEFDSSIKVSEDPFTKVVAWKSEEQCSISENSKLLASDNPTFNATIPFSAVITVDSQNVNNILHLDGNCLLTNIASSEEIKGKKLVEGAFEGCSIHKGEQNASNDYIQAMPENEDGNHDVDEREELLQIDGGKKGSSDILPLVEVQVNDEVTSAEFDSSIKVSEDPFTKVVAWKSEEQCSLSENSKLLASDNRTFNSTIPQGSEVSPLDSRSFSDEADTGILRQTEGNINSAEDSSTIIHLGSKKSATKSSQEVPIVKPPPNAAPFSDEWLAAIEAAGEEILTMKGGAVQNSPPDKSQQEPGPWSPVKKNQAIGPFDCTKHNLQHSGS